MENSQLIKKENGGGYSKVYPLAYIQGIIDSESGERLSDILIRFNHIYVPWAGSKEETRKSIPVLMRRHGLWISYDLDGSLYTEWFKNNNIDALLDIKWQDSDNWEMVPNLSYVNSLSQQIPNGSILPEMLSSSLQELLSKHHTIINLPDDEDLEQHCNVIRFKDREYNAALASGKGRKILRKSWFNRKNTLSQEAFDSSNTIYEVRYDFDLMGKTITIPRDCVLEFTGGSIKNGKMVFDNTTIAFDSAVNILPDTCEGKITNSTIFPEWFASKKDFTEAIQTSIDVAPESGATILFTGGRYLIRGGVLLFKSNLTFKSYNKSTIYTEDATSYRAMFFSDPKKSSDNVTFDGITFDQSAQEYCQAEEDNVQMFCILTWKSVNLTVKNCKFINVGTNCVVCNGDSCHNTQILNNYFYFIRNKNAGNYDNSVVYISDTLHKIEGNVIVNDGSSENRSRGGIETHGFCGTVKNNIISNCNNAINIVEVDTEMPEGLEANRLISGNICYNCNNFCAFWAATTFNTIKNVVISNNIASNVRSAVASVLTADNAGNMQDIEICNNYFSGRYREIADRASADEYMESAFTLFSYGNVQNMRIHNNIIANFPKMLLSTNPYGKSQDSEDWVQEIYFTNNSCVNCFNSVVKEGVVIDTHYSLFTLGVYTKLVVKDNSISIPTDKDRNSPLYLFRSTSYGIVGFEYSNNKIEGENTINYTIGASGDSSKIKLDFTSPSEPRIYAYNNVGTHYLYPNDTVITDDASYVVTTGGHFDTNIPDTSNLVLTFLYHQMGLLTGSGLDNIQIGDLLHFRLPSKEFVATVVERTTSGLYVKSSSIQSGTEGTLTWLRYWKAVMDTYSKTIVYAKGSEPEGSRGSVGYDTTTRRLTVYNGTAWKDVDNLADVPILGSTANRPTLTTSDYGIKYYDTNLQKYIYWNGQKWVDEQGFTPLVHRGATDLMPTTEDGLTAYDYGFLFYDFNERRLKVWNSTGWNNVDGSPLGMGISRGGTSSRPANLDASSVGYMYYDTALNRMIVWGYSGWTNMDGSSLEKILDVGTTAQRPTGFTASNNGFQYFDITLKKPIYWLNTRWVDATGQDA